MPDLKIEPDRVWLRFSHLASVVTITALAVLLYTRFEMRMQHIEDTIASDAKTRSEDRAAVVASINEVRDELRRIRIDTVSARQMETWIEFARTANKGGPVTWPDLPR